MTTQNQNHRQEVRDIFAWLTQIGYAPRLSEVSGCYHFLIDDVGRLDLRVDHGHLTPGTPEHVDPECTLQASADHFVAIMTGEKNAITALMRGDISVDGDPILMTKFAMATAAQKNVKH